MIGWFIVPYKRSTDLDHPRARYIAMNDFKTQITTDGGDWSGAECLGNHAVVKVSALPATLTMIAQEEGFIRVPVTALDNTLSSLSQAQRTVVKNKIIALGYPLSEIVERLGQNLSNVTFRQVFKFILRRRLKPRYDPDLDEIILDGPEQVCNSIELVDSEV